MPDSAEDGVDSGSPYIQSCCWATAYNAMEVPVTPKNGAPVEVPLVKYWVVIPIPVGDGRMFRTLVFPGAEFSMEVGSTPADCCWSSSVHHAYGLSAYTSPR